MGDNSKIYHQPTDIMDFNFYEYSEEQLLNFKIQDDQIIRIAGKLIIPAATLIFFIFCMANSVNAKTLAEGTKRKSKIVTLTDIKNMLKDDLHNEIKNSSYANKINRDVAKNKVKKLIEANKEKFALKISKSKIWGSFKLANTEVNPPVELKAFIPKTLEGKSSHLNGYKIKKINLSKFRGGSTSLLNLFSLFQLQKILIEKNDSVKNSEEENRQLAYNSIFNNEKTLSAFLEQCLLGSFSTILFSMCLIVSNKNQKSIKNSEEIISEENHKRNEQIAQEKQSFYFAIFNFIISNKYKVVIISILFICFLYYVLETRKENKISLNSNFVVQGTKLIKQFTNANFEIRTKLVKFREKDFLSVHKLKSVDPKMITEKINWYFRPKKKKKSKFNIVTDMPTFEIFKMIKDVSTGSVDIVFKPKKSKKYGNLKKIYGEASYLIKELYLLLEEKKSKEN